MKNFKLLILLILLLLLPSSLFASGISKRDVYLFILYTSIISSILISLILMLVKKYLSSGEKGIKTEIFSWIVVVSNIAFLALMIFLLSGLVENSYYDLTGADYFVYLYLPSFVASALAGKTIYDYWKLI